MRMNLYKMLMSVAVVCTTACGGKSFNVAGEADSFQQSNSATSVPVDILWVVDNSGSMDTSQNQLATSVPAFISKFTQTNFDFRMAVVTTDAYKGMSFYGGDPTLALFRDGERDYYPNDGMNDATSSGVFVISPSTPNINTVFQTNLLQGIYGGGDERGFQSMEGALLNSTNAARPFPRPGSFLVVIFLTDEEDFSWSGTAGIQDSSPGVQNVITDPRLLPVSYFTGVLDTVTNSTATKKNYMVSTIAIFDETCRQQLTNTTFTGRRIAERYAQLVDATGGVKASLCSDFSDIMSNISDSILQFSTKFYLTRTPVPGTLQIYVNGVLVPESNYVYSETENSVTFGAAHIPPQDASIRVAFTPSTLK